jgi:hypothetical protein
MCELIELRFENKDENDCLLPAQCNLSAACYDDAEVRRAVAVTMGDALYAIATTGLDLRALDGITMSHDCKNDAIALQQLPEGYVPLDMTERPDSMEMARTVAVRREGELRFHVLFRPAVGLMMLSPEESLYQVAYACIAHEAAHVDHESHLYRTFGSLYGRPLECGERSRQTFLKAMDVWSEYSASRSSAMFRPEAVEEFEGLFCRALVESLTACRELIASYRRDQKAYPVFREVQQLFGDVFIHAGYFLGHLDGLEMNLKANAHQASAMLEQYPKMETLFVRLRRVLHEMWLTEYAWTSIEVFAPIYDLICEMMALHGLAFARHQEEWRIIFCDDDEAMPEIHDALTRWMNKP